jgi:hypothetical protein
MVRLRAVIGFSQRQGSNCFTPKTILYFMSYLGYISGYIKENWTIYVKGDIEKGKIQLK